MSVEKDEIKSFQIDALNRRQAIDAKQKLIEFKQTWKLEHKNTISRIELFFISIILLTLLFVLIPRIFSHDDNFILATNYYNNNNYTDAIKYLELSCQDGNGEACVAAGVMYDSGEYIPENNEKAISLYASSCKLKYTQGCLNLEQMTQETK